MYEYPEKKLLSIVIPLYNGAVFLSDTLDSIVSQGLNDEVEVVLCDDVSTDRTFEIAKNYADVHRNIRLLRNTENLGMDGNFDKVATLATAEYFWFCGQDDILDKGSIKKVLEVLHTNPLIDFIYVNYSQHNHDLSKVITDRMIHIEDDILCKEPQSFLSVTGLERLPTFLPSFVLRKSLWDRVERRPFYGTHYIQIGVLLSLLPELTTYIIANPYVKGRIPDDGWQKNTFKLIDILTGFFEVITYSYRKQPQIYSHERYSELYKIKRSMVFDLIYRMRIEGLTLNDKLKGRLRYIFDSRDCLLFWMLFKIPRRILVMMYNIAKGVLRVYRIIRHRLLDIRIKILSWHSPLKIIIGASGTVQSGWIPTDIEHLNLLDCNSWKRYFSEGSIDAILAEHVWEHLNEQEAVTAAINCFKYLKNNGYIRVAVPDGFHHSTKYIDAVKPGGSGAGSDDHKILYNYKTLSEVFSSAGFKVEMLEWFDEKGVFNFKEWDKESGLITRSSRFDHRNKDGQLNYTSLIIDAWKK